MQASDFYFTRFEHRKPPPPLPHSRVVETIWQVLAIATAIAGAIYIHWRWTESLNFDALWFALPLAAAETLAYIGLLLFTLNLWKVKDYPKRPPPETIAQCLGETALHTLERDRPISVDLFIATYNEDEELVRISIRDAKKVTYPHPLDLRIHVLDDGRRPTMRAVAEQEGISYISRDNNIGFKAGNMRNAMDQTSGDFIVICDADTRVFPTILDHTLGYFRDPDVALVQTPQWFYDLPEGTPLPEFLGAKLGVVGRMIGRGVQAVIGEVRIGEDPFANEPKIFYDVIQRRRNAYNAAFCCGAGSIHRREAVMFVALKEFSDSIEKQAGGNKRRFAVRPSSPDPAQLSQARWSAALTEEVTPYKFHVSEDIYSTIVLHQDRERGWKTVLHPDVESKMLSPQDLLTWSIQRFKYAGGSLDIFFHDNPVLAPGMTLGQRLMYLATFYSYVGAVWNFVFLFAPIVYMTFGIPPVAAYTGTFFAYALPFLILNELAFLMGTWGISGFKGKVSYLASFPLSLRALWAVIRKREIKFTVTPKERQSGNYFRLVWPQAAILVLTIASFIWAIGRDLLGYHNYSTGGLIANGLWGLHNLTAMWVMVSAAYWKPKEEPAGAPESAEVERLVVTA